MKLKAIMVKSGGVVTASWRKEVGDSFGFLAALLVFGFVEASQAAFSYSGGNYSEQFDTLAVSGTSNPWANDSTLSGWFLFRQDGVSGPPLISTYRADAGGNNAGSFYSWGASGNGERALGGLGSSGAYFGNPVGNSVAGWIALALKNESGNAFSSVTLSYTGEQWRNGGNTTAQTMVLEYGFGATFDSVSGWTAGGSSFNFTSLVNTATAGSVDGNASGNQTVGLGGTISQTWNNGDTLWIRWIEKDDVGTDHGLAIDNFTLSATPVPEPSTFIAGALLALPFGVQGVRYLRNRKRA